MTKIGGTCLFTIGIWVIIELVVQFVYYKHSCGPGAGERCLRARLLRERRKLLHRSEVSIVL